MVHTNSNLRRHFGDYLLLGDSGYPLEPFLMTPVTNSTNEAEELYNRALVRTRVIVELTLGVVKNRFRCIHLSGGELQYTPLRSAKIVSHVSGGSSKPAYVLSREEVKLNVRGKRVRWIQVVVPRYQ
ncbi:hypothetical protein Pcinc_040195 [Petrolisthes cinctipes]|uniref:DDE Tnp4 domain-containing protein n=1 Tax=Petrolisthes cinctipes TaxID=88211 RepID=A0AAE1EL24_PETCI|nr:hypothetical protein Pcinc_040195 [Petrolisthes cinctipes]